MAAVELGRNLHRQLAAGKGLRSVICVRRRREEVSAEAYENLGPPLMHGFDRSDGIEAMFVRRREGELFAKCLHELRAHFLPNANRAIALHVAMAANGAKARAAATDVAPEEREVDDGLHVADAVSMLRNAH